jgi:hypothetical protein
MAALVRRAESQVVRRTFGSVSELTAALYASLVDWLEQTGGLRVKPFDTAACPEATLADLAASKLELFLSRAQAQRAYAHGPGTPMTAALAHLNLLDHGAPSHAAVLLFGERPQRFLPASELKCMHFHGTELSKPIPSHQVFKGTVFELVDAALDFVLSKVARRVGTRAETTQVPVSYELPHSRIAAAGVPADQRAVRAGAAASTGNSGPGSHPGSRAPAGRAEGRDVSPRAAGRSRPERPGSLPQSLPAAGAGGEADRDDRTGEAAEPKPEVPQGRPTMIGGRRASSRRQTAVPAVVTPPRKTAPPARTAPAR